jgi:predicted secreted protein
MGIAGSLMVLAIAWWIAFQAMLPFGVRSQLEDNSVVPGSEPGAPTLPQLGRKAIFATLIAIAVWALLFYVIEYRVLTLDDIPGPTSPKPP